MKLRLFIYPFFAALFAIGIWLSHPAGGADTSGDGVFGPKPCPMAPTDQGCPTGCLPDLEPKWCESRKEQWNRGQHGILAGYHACIIGCFRDPKCQDDCAGELGLGVNENACWYCYITGQSCSGCEEYGYDDCGCNASGHGSVALADSRLSLATDQGSAPLRAGDRLTVSLSMSNLEREVVGYQAFISFDERQLRFVSGAYTLEPFGLYLIDHISASGGAISLAAGINTESGQTQTAEDALLATFVFESVTGGCATDIGFQPHEPPTTLADDQGQPVLPLILEDVVTDCDVDILSVLVAWGPCHPDGDCPEDLDDSGSVDVGDILEILREMDSTDD